MSWKVRPPFFNFAACSAMFRSRGGTCPSLNFVRQHRPRSQLFLKMRLNNLFQQPPKFTDARRGGFALDPVLDADRTQRRNHPQRARRDALTGTAAPAMPAHKGDGNRIVETVLTLERPLARHAPAQVRKEPSEPQQPVIEKQKRPIDFGVALEYPQHDQQQPEDTLIHFPVRQKALGDFSQILRRKLDAIIPLHLEEGFHNLSRTNPLQVPVLPIINPDPNIAEWLQRSAVAAPAAQSTLGHGA